MGIGVGDFSSSSEVIFQILNENNILEYNIDFFKMYLRLKSIIEKVLFKYVNTAKKYIAIGFFLVFFTNMIVIWSQ